MRRHDSDNLTGIFEMLEREAAKCSVRWRVLEIDERGGGATRRYVVDAHREIGGLHINLSD